MWSSSMKVCTIICWANWIMLTSSFVPHSSTSTRNPCSSPPSRSGSILLLDSRDTGLRLSVADVSSSILMAEEQSWRQYVPLAVSGFVIVDILLGSPAANSVMGLMRAQENKEDDEDSSEEGTSSSPRPTKRRRAVNTAERVDSLAVAQAAIDKANATLELKRFLEDKKTDWDKMEDIRKKMDRQMQEFDEKIKEQRGQE